MVGAGQDPTHHWFFWLIWEHLSSLSLSSASTSCQIPSGSFLLSGPLPYLLLLMFHIHTFLLAVTTFACLFICLWASLVTEMVKNLPAIARDQSQEDPLEEEMTTHSSILAWKIPWTERHGRLWSTGPQTVRHDWVTNTFTLLAVFSSLGG